jgi:hypothetical protein
MYVPGGTGRTESISTLMNIVVATYPRVYVRPMEKHELELLSGTYTMYYNVLLHDCTRHTTHAKLVARRRRQSKQRDRRRHVRIRRSIDSTLIDFVFEPLHARFNYTLEGCSYNEGLNSHHGDLPHCSPSDYLMEGDLSAEQVFFHPP